MELNTNFNKGISQNIIFIHGNSSSSNVFEPMMESSLSYSMYSYDLLGHGDSPRLQNYKDYSFINQCEKSIELINTLDGEKILVGNSYGGHIAIEISEEINDLNGIVIFGTPPLKSPLNLEEAFAPNEATPTFFTENPNLSQIENAIKITSQNTNINQIIIDDFLKSDPLVRRAIVEDVSNTNVFKDEYKIFCELDIPKLILHGDCEPLVNIDYIKQVANESNADLKIIENCGHYVSLEKPQEFISIINKFGEKCFNV